MRVFFGAMLATTIVGGAAQAATILIHAGRGIADPARPASGRSTIID